MELEFFCEPDKDLEWFEYWKNYCINWLQTLGIKEDEMRVRDHEKEELSPYSKQHPTLNLCLFGWGELWYHADRTDAELLSHQNYPSRDLTYFDDVNKETFIHM